MKDSKIQRLFRHSEFFKGCWLQATDYRLQPAVARSPKSEACPDTSHFASFVIFLSVILLLASVHAEPLIIDNFNQGGPPNALGTGYFD
ncbi:MAG: hypothetical protein AB1765_08725, partial [Candidatus Hydrogenedentota bacterium]